LNNWLKIIIGGINMNKKVIRSRAFLGLLIVMCVMFAGCSLGKLNIVGMWKNVDGTTCIFNSDGTCKNVAKIDIGGSLPIYNISEKPDDNGYYSLIVSQDGYNQTTFYVKVISNDSIEIYESLYHTSGMITTKPLYSLKRQ
jgi:hypothetical protein